MNKNELGAAMALYGDTGKTLSEALGISQQRFSCKRNEKNGAQFNQNEIKFIKMRYNLTPEEVDRIFFAKTVS